MHLGPENQKAYILWSALPEHIETAQIRLTRGCAERAMQPAALALLCTSVTGTCAQQSCLMPLQTKTT